ncbi:GMC family oxidoreductase N-terminal domain-containing protein [Clostridium sp. HBUAS56010]|uniref:GMC family oxidoreductase N-terminal domain-containing protein n=1 Tax=Clostridium sp. HBUAS56010 TaxID=2571127 RepID=UPI001177BC84|nr:GMC family oxidoreductase N-terminal domain-containing protein [Clostridium sp. HBUAS56010]
MNNGYDADVIVIGAGGGGGVVAKELGEKGIKVLVVEAGPWYGNSKWQRPNEDAGAGSSRSVDDLDINLLKRDFTDLEDDMNDPVSGKLRWGPANRDMAPWVRIVEGGGFLWQTAGVGGTTLVYFSNCPRAYPVSFQNEWPISYEELVPYYEKVENTLPVSPATGTSKENLFYYGAKKAGFSYIEVKDVTEPGYRVQPNCIFPVNSMLNNPDFDIETNQAVGCTLRGHCVNGCNMGPSVDTVAKRSTMVSYIPMALRTGNVEVMPNTFAVKINTAQEGTQGLSAQSVTVRNTWTGEVRELKARVIVMAAGAIETPRLWLNSQLPENEWVGKGLTTHMMDCVSGIFEEEDLMNALGMSDVKPFIGQNSAARLDYPGLGTFEPFGLSPGLYSFMSYGVSQKGYYFQNEVGEDSPWDREGIIAGELLKENMKDYQRTLSIIILADDSVQQSNGISLDPVRRDENGFIPVISYRLNDADTEKREQLVRVACNVLRSAGAKTITRANWQPDSGIHIMSTMRMGQVTDNNCEAKQVSRLFIADNSVLGNGLGGPNPTLTTQALATRTAEKIAEKYFS